MLIRGEPWRRWLGEHPDFVVTVICVVAGISAMVLTWME